ncbi:MAG TPA: replicative DNA helicase [Negativicutes bacterium]|nr:replicative DNA helicase [Negativicutes bacterium]
MLERVPPQNLEAEQSVLGSMLIEREAIAKAMEELRPEDFYRDAHRMIYQCMISLYDRNEPLDLITVSEDLRQKDQLEKVGGLSYLTTLASIVPTAANVYYYARIVAEKALLRQLIHAATEIAATGYEAAEDVAVILDQAEKSILAISQRTTSQSFAPIKGILLETFEKIDQLYSSKGGIVGIPSGFRDLDNMTAGFQPSDLILLAARPSMGKTALCLNIAQHIAIREKKPVAFFSLEMSKEQLVQRMLCAEAGIDAHRLRTGDLRDEDWKHLSRGMGTLSEAPIFIDDTPGVPVMEMRTKCRRLKIEQGLGIIIIDYIQLIQGNGRTENRQQEISEISRSLKSLARELNVPVIALSQLSRAVESRAVKKPMLSDLRESGSLEQDADLVAFIYRDDYYNPDTDKPNITEIMIAKHRNGPVGSIELYFHKEYTRFIPLDKVHNDH